MAQRLPDFFVVGAPKCGTTTLHHWLRAHPALFLPEHKEPMYFCGYDGSWRGPGAAIVWRKVVAELRDYQALFAAAPATARAGEASVDYLHEEAAARNIRAAIPQARIVAVLRQPVERAYSEHMHLVRDASDAPDFETALEREPQRITERWIPMYHHVRRSRYHDAVRRYFELFGAESVRVLLYEDLLADPAGFLGAVHAHLGVEPRPPPDEAVLNPGRGVRRHWLNRLVVSPPPAVKKAAAVVPERLRATLRDAAVASNRAPAPPLAPEVARRVFERYFRADVEALESLLGRDLSAWKP